MNKTQETIRFIKIENEKWVALGDIIVILSTFGDDLDVKALITELKKVRNE